MTANHVRERGRTAFVGRAFLSIYFVNSRACNLRVLFVSLQGFAASWLLPDNQTRAARLARAGAR
jgi:hypothetical protein